jgi:hypothetical protein
MPDAAHIDALLHNMLSSNVLSRIEVCSEIRLRARRGRDNAIIFTPRQWIDSNPSAISASYRAPILQPTSRSAWAFLRTTQSRVGFGIMSTSNPANRTRRSVEQRTDRYSSTMHSAAVRQNLWMCPCITRFERSELDGAFKLVRERCQIVSSCRTGSCVATQVGRPRLSVPR